MMDAAKHRRTGKEKKSDRDLCPQGILDIIEADYPAKYAIISQGHNRIKKLFSSEEWIDILTKSRKSYERHF